MGDVLTLMFSTDIILNFNTGFILDDNLVLDRCKIVRHYLSGWFFLDFIATIPFDWLDFQQLSSLFRFDVERLQSVSLLRLGKVAQASRALKILRLLRLARMAYSRENYLKNYSFTLNFGFGNLLKPLKAFILVIVFAHIHACILALVEPDFQCSDDMIQALIAYYDNFCWAFAFFCGGTIGGSERATAPILWTLEIVMASERLLMLVLVARLCSSFAIDAMARSRVDRAKSNSVRFLRQHNVSMQTQLQVLFSIEQIGNARSLHRSFEDLLNQEVSAELQIRIREELWTTKLTSLELISFMGKMHYEFIHDLTQVVKEEWFAYKAVLFRKGDVALMCYHIITGQLAIVPNAKDAKLKIPDFTEGMWVGERALVNRSFVRSTTMFAKSMVQVLEVPADGFHKLVHKYDLRGEFDCLCKETVWRGLCGRCGVLGAHFSNECPLLKGKYSRGTGSVHADLRMFLEARGLEWLTPTLLATLIRI